MSKLKTTDVNWALRLLSLEGDTDLFPKSFEIEVLRAHEREVVAQACGLDITQYRWHEPRRALVPTGNVALRPAAQLEPFDALLFTALVHSCANKIEKYRADPTGQRIFSYRVARSSTGRLYAPDRYKRFWEASKAAAGSAKLVLTVDISDFYNQIYHHTIEQEMACAGVPKPTQTALLNLFKTCSVTTSRGLPIGPHATHLIAELSLRPIDDLLHQSGFQYVRFVDDMHIFCSSELEARARLYKIAEALDLMKLQLNRTKTNIVDSQAWTGLCDNVLQDRPINAEEAALLAALSSLSISPYEIVTPQAQPSPLDATLTPESIATIIDAYLAQPSPDYIRLRWLFRRLSQTGSAAAVDYVVANFERLAPAIAEVVRYLRGSISNYSGKPASLGEGLIGLLESPVVASSPYLQAMLISVFAAVPSLNHFSTLVQRFDAVKPIVQREIVRAATNAVQKGWLKSLKGLEVQDAWVRRAVMMGAMTWSDDERIHWAKSHKSRYEFIDDVIASDLSKKTTRELSRHLSRAAKKQARQLP